MPDLLLFVEDSAQEKFLSVLLKRLATEKGVALNLRIRTARGGYAKVLVQLENFVKEVAAGSAARPDGLVVAVDANCKGFNARRSAVQRSAGALSDFVVYAIPDPHIERWFLLDSEAFKTSVGRGCAAPDEKCEKDRYKRVLSQAVLQAGVQPLLGGVEYAEDIANAYHIQRVVDADNSFARLVSEFRTWLNKQRQDS